MAKIASARVGELHHDAMQDLLGNLPTGPNSRSKAARCQLAAEVTLRQMPHIEASFGMQWTDAERRRLVREAFRSIGACQSQHLMNMFEGHGGTVARATMAMDDPPGTDAVIGPINDLVTAVKNSDGTVASIDAITSASLANNSSLGDVDLQILASVAALANSSAAEWNAYSAGGGFGDETWQGEWDWSGGGGAGAPVGCTNWPGECPTTEEPYSIFKGFGFWRKAGFVVGSDVIACATAAVAARVAGAQGAAAACGVWGVGTSAGALLGVLLL